MVRMGLYQSAKDFVGWPITPGFEVTGRVVSVGPEVQDLAVGDAVLAVTLFNGYATQVAVRRPYVFRLPDDVDPVAMAGFPAVFLTAYFALFELAHPRPGSKILIHSAAGGVGTALVQLARSPDVGDRRRRGRSQVGDLGEVGVDRHRQIQRTPVGPRQACAPDGFDVICDANGVATSRQLRASEARWKVGVYGFHDSRAEADNWLKLIVDYLCTPLQSWT